MSDRISRDELVKIYNIEITFFDSLDESGLVKTETENNVKYLLYDELPTFERLTNWHYDLEVTLPGLKIIHNLLQKMDKLREDNRRLRSFSYFPVEDWDVQ